MDALRLFTNKSASGGLPAEKDNGVRPIACGEVLCRFHLLPLQVGVNLRDAATWLAEGSLPEVVKEEWLHQKWWVTQVEKQQLEIVMSKASGRNVVRLQCLSRNASGAWLHAIPSKALGLELSRWCFSSW